VAKIDVTQVEGFDELNRKLKRLDDSVKRREVLTLQRRLAKPVQQRYASNLPEDSGTLSKSVAVKTVSARRSGGNPSVVVRPGKRGRYDGYYKFMVIRKGDRPGSIERGSRKGINTVTEKARDKTLSQLGTGLVTAAEDKTAAYLQKKIDKLSAI
jgi:hypothetical protein